MNNKGGDQTARMRRLVCACVVRKSQKTGFLASRPILFIIFKPVLTLCIRENLKRAYTFASSEDPDEMQHNAALNQGLHCL